MNLMFFPLSSPWFCNLCHHGLLTCKSCNTRFLLLSSTYVSLGNGMVHDPVSYRSRTIVLLLVMDLEILLPCTAQMLDIRSYGVLLSYMWYTKRLLFCPYFFSGSNGTLSSLDLPSTPIWMDMCSDIGSLLVEGLLVKPLPASKTYVVTTDTSSVVVVN
jgi:hypothetical protein